MKHFLDEVCVIPVMKLFFCIWVLKFDFPQVPDTSDGTFCCMVVSEEDNEIFQKFTLPEVILLYVSKFAAQAKMLCFCTVL